MSDDVELRELRVFLVLAEELHFGRTAQRLHLTPSRVSQTLRALERKLGGKLVDRTSRRVVLTALGERFRDEAGKAQQQFDAMLERTRAARRTVREPFRVGLLQGGIEGPELPLIVQAFERHNPDRTVQMTRPRFGDAFEVLRRGEIDVLVSWLPLKQRDLTIGPVLGREPRVLAVARDHPLATRASVSYEDLADYQTLSVVEEVQPKEIADELVPQRTPSGRPIPRSPISLGALAREDAGQVRSQMGWMIASGEVVLPVVPAVESILGPNIVYVPIKDMRPIRRALVWKRGTTDAGLYEFIKTARECLRAIKSSKRAEG